MAGQMESSLPLSVNETQGERVVVHNKAASHGAGGIVMPAGVYLDGDDESELAQAEKGETVSLPLNKLGLIDIYFATDAQTFNPNDYHPLLEGRLSKDEFLDFLSRLNQDIREQVGGQVKKGWIYATLALILVWVLLSLWHGAKAFKHHNASIIDFFPMPIFIGFMIFLIKRTSSRRTAQNVARAVTSACKQLNDKYGKRGLHFRFVYDRYDSENANLLEIEIVPVPELGV